MADPKIGLMMISVVLLSMVISSSETSNATIEIPCQDNATFRETCAQVEGKMAGNGRCYFMVNSGHSWSDGFSTCSNLGAQFAQIHTTKEFNLVQTMVDSVKTYRPWIALRRSFYDHGRPCAVTGNTTFWYDSDSDKPDANRTKVAAENSAMSLRQANTSTCGDKQQDYNDKQEACIMWQGPTWFDHGCACYLHRILCQYTSRSQKYTKTADICIDEPPIEEFKANAPGECAQRCSRSIWCRSFNFVEDLARECTTTCQLFAWSIEEECPTCPQTRPNYEKDTMCYHWNYVW